MTITFATEKGMGGMKEHQLAHHADRVEAAIGSGQAAKSALVASWRRSSRLHQLDPSGTRLNR
jgi:transcriptional regulator of acetoin/glycerol metabolism